MTLSDLEKKAENEKGIKNRLNIGLGFNSGGGLSKSEKMGMICLELTNKFRASKNEGHLGGLPALEWSKQLHDIALGHSQNMGNGKVKFGHGGFKNRHK